MAVRNSGTNRACKAKQDTYGMGDIVTAEAMIKACRKRGRIVWASGGVRGDRDHGFPQSAGIQRVQDL